MSGRFDTRSSSGAFAICLLVGLLASACGAETPTEGGTSSDATGDTGPIPDGAPDGGDAEPDAMDPECATSADCLATGEGNKCLLAICDTQTWRCVVGPKKDHTPCDDGNACTNGEVCLAGACSEGAKVICGDGNPCTDDACHDDSGCVHLPNTKGCDDANVCTMDDSCVDQVCSGSIDPGCVCDSDADCLTYDDGDLCNGVFVCAGGLCTTDPASIVACDTAADTECFKTVCEPSSGTCVPKFLSGFSCQDGSICTVGDLCDEGVCAAGENKCACDVDEECSDYDDTDLCNGALSCVDGLCEVTPESIVACSTDGLAPCEVAVCLPETGACEVEHDPDGAACDDSDACTAGDVCSDGTCLGSAADCDDLIPCTLDGCDSASGCTHTPDDAPCGDGNPCTDDSCDDGVGCIHLDNAASCDDGDVCTGDGLCSEGACAAGEPIVCDDDNPCTDDSCDPVSGCGYVANAASCDDGDPCTSDDLCVSAKCAGEVYGCSECESCDGQGACLIHEGQCKIDAVCYAEGALNPDNPCQECDGGQPDSWTNDDGNACDDGADCSVGDSCQGGFCAGQGLDCAVCETCNPAGGCDLQLNACKIDGDCILAGDANPANPCQSCQPAADPGGWTDDDSKTCDDGDPCNGAELCSAGACTAGAPPSCDDGDMCTDDSCQKGAGCQHAPNTAPCDDSDACTVDDVCGAGACQGGAAPDCDDGNPCTDDGCDAASGCIHADNSAPCDDADACTLGDTCEGGVCASSSAPDCDDGNPCTDDQCGPATGCVSTANDLPCDDGEVCIVDSVCADGVCGGGVPLDCDDENPCTDDGCVAGQGCVLSANSEICDDGDACTKGDSCSLGECVSGQALGCDDGNPCTDDSCAPATGCVHGANDLPCDDGEECIVDTVCVGGVCGGGVQLDCGDGNPCTDDGCVTGQGCVQSPNSIPCDDGDACTEGDACSLGGCLSGKTVSCDDSNPCTDDGCDVSAGCAHFKNTAPCEDGDPCTVGDTCLAGNCGTGDALDCSEFDTACLDGVCDPAIGDCAQSAKADGTDCDDGDPCSWATTCQGGICGAGDPVDCDDDNPCTDDACNVFGVCEHVANTAPCDDDNGCTSGESCQGGSCQGGDVLDCSEFDAGCLEGVCDPAIGDCAQQPRPDGSPCDDGSPCSATSSCQNGVCASGSPVDCSSVDGPCAVGECQPGGGCVPVPVADGSACFDDVLCGAPGTCAAGACDCTPPDCSDLDDDCVLGVWKEAASSCVTVPTNEDGICNGDFNACTVDSCDDQGACQIGPSPDCSGRSDSCNSGFCATVTPTVWVCSGVPKAGASCDDGTDCTEAGTSCQDAAVAAWAYDHGKSTVDLVLDHTGQGHHGTPNDGAVVQQGGPTGAMIACDGIAGEVLVADSPNLNFTQGLTVSTWFRTDSLAKSSQVLVSKDKSFMLGVNFGVLSCAVRIDSQWSWYGTASADVDTWHHGACTYDLDVIHIYLDGAIVDSEPLPGAMTPSPLDTRLCARPEGLRLEGDMADTRIYPRALTPGEVWGLAVDPAVADGCNAVCGGESWDSTCCEVDGHCEDTWGCTSDQCLGGVCANDPPFNCDLPGDGCDFGYCFENLDKIPLCGASGGGQGDPIWSQDFESWTPVGDRANGIHLLVGDGGSDGCAWHHVSAAEVEDNVTPLGCSDWGDCLYAGNTTSWDYAQGLCDAGAVLPTLAFPQADNAYLVFDFWAQILDSEPGADRLEVHVDGILFAMKDATALDTDGGWDQFVVDVSGFADGGDHQISLHFRTSDNVFNDGKGVLVDQITLWVDDDACP